MFHICFLCQTACFSLRPICHLPFAQSATCPLPHRSCSTFLHQLDFFHVHISYLFPLSDCMCATASCCDEKMLLVWFSQVPQLTWFTRGSENLTGLVWFGKDAQSPSFTLLLLLCGLWVVDHFRLCAQYANACAKPNHAPLHELFCHWLSWTKPTSYNPTSNEAWPPRQLH